MPPADFKMEESTSAGKSTARLIGIESGHLTFESSQGIKTLNLSGVCPFKQLSEETLVFSCLKFSEREALAQAGALNLKEVEIKPLLNIPDLWEVQFESYFYWPEIKKLVPVAEITTREAKNEIKNSFQADKFDSNFYLILRLKKSVTLDSKKVLSTWKNEKEFELSEVDYDWQKKEENKVSKSIEFNELYHLSDLKVGTIIELNLIASKKIPEWDIRKTRVRIPLFVNPYPRAYERKEGNCDLVERFFKGYHEESFKLEQDYAAMKFRLNVDGKQYALSELIAWGKAFIVSKNSMIKIQLMVHDKSWEDGMTLSVLPYEKQKIEIGFLGYENCTVNNADVIAPLSLPNSIEKEFVPEEIYRGTLIIKEGP